MSPASAQHCQPDSGNFPVAALAEGLEQLTPDTTQTALLSTVEKVFPGLGFKTVLTRTGWYRLGGVIDPDGKHISHDLASWVEAAVKDDLEVFYNRYADAQYRVSRLNGKTHYLVACTGERPQDFLQLEIEEVEEVIDRALLEDTTPDLVEELIDPVEYLKLELAVVTPARYVFRRLIPIADMLDCYSEQLDANMPILRFMQDWQRSSAGEAAPFCEHWVLAFREYADGYGEPRFSAKPVSTCSGEFAAVDDPVPRGAALANLIHSFDRQAGYPMAWYFFMLSHKSMPHAIAESIHQDQMGAYDYLPARDLKVLQDWYDRGYAV